MKVRASFPSACRPEEAVLAPLETLGEGDRATADASGATSAPAHAQRAGTSDHLKTATPQPRAPHESQISASDYYRTTAPHVMVASSLVDTLP